MGCGGSKVDDQPLVILCKERKELIKMASHQRCALAAAHLGYFQSLRDVGEAIRRFVDEEFVVGSSSSPRSPVLTLPSDEGKPPKHKISSSSTSISHSAIEEEEDAEDSHLHLSAGSESGWDNESDASEGHINIDSSPDQEEEEEERPPVNFSPGYPPGYPVGYPPGYPPAYPPGYTPGYPPGFGYPPVGWGFMDDRNAYPGMYGNTNPGIYYMKKSVPPSRSVVFQPENHRAENGQWPADPGFGSSDYFSGYQNSGFLGYPRPSGGYYTQFQRRSPSPAPPPAPPPPPPVSTWDYLNVFDTYDYSSGVPGYPGYYPQSTAGIGSDSGSPDSREVREREGIPDLEEETEQEVIKEAYKGTMKKKNKNKMKEHKDEEDERHMPEMDGIYESNMNRRGFSGEGTSKAVPMAKTANGSSSSGSKRALSSSNSDLGSEFHHVSDNEGKSSNSNSGHETITTTKNTSGEIEEEYGTGRKKGVSFELEETTTTTNSLDVESSKISGLTTLSFHGTRDLKEVVKEIKNEFEVASNYGKEVAVLLEVSKLPYQQKNNGFKVIFSRIMYLVAPSILPSCSQPQQSMRVTSKTLKMAKAYAGQDIRGFTGNLSCTLDKLYEWEKKLYKEVKDEEKLRVIYEEKCKRLKRLDQHGAESSKVDATRAAIRKLLTKIDICIRSVDSISSRIHKLRDEELQPQLTQLIHGLIRMWRSMLKCHQKQFQAIMEGKVRSLRANTGLQRDSGLKATLELEMELREWCTSFNTWVSTQKSYVESLNGWLSKCLHYEPEETEDGIAPFSPSRIDAPPIFIICKDWQDAMARISGEKVTNAMQGFASSLHELWERQDEEQRQRVKAEYVTQDFEKRLNDLRMEKSKMGNEEQETMSGKQMVSRVRSNSGVSPLDDLKVDLDSMRKKLAEERARHKEAIKLVNNAASSSLQAGLIPIFEALGRFTSEAVKAHEDVRLQHPQTSS